MTGLAVSARRKERLGKRKAALSIADLRMLGRVLQFASLKQASENLHVPRTHLRRLMMRAAREVGADLDWRAAGPKTLSAPAEIWRLVSPERLRVLELAAGFPCM